MSGPVIEMRAAGRTLLAAIAFALPCAPATAQEQDCAAIVRDMYSQRDLAQQARLRAAVLRQMTNNARVIFGGIAEREPRYTPVNLHAAIAETRNDPYFGTATARGEMLRVHIRILDNAADLVAGNEFLDIFGLQQNPLTALRNFQAQLEAEAQQAETEAGRYEWAANSLGESFSYCLQQIAQGALADIQAREAQASTPPAPQGAPPAGMTTLCQLTGGPRQGEIMDMTREYGPAHYIAIGDVCYDNNSDTSIGLGIAQ